MTTIDELYDLIKWKGVTRVGDTLSAGGSLYLGSLTTLPEGVTLIAGDSLDLSSLTTLPEGVTLSAGGSLYLGSLTTLPEGVTLSAGGSLYLGSLTTLPEGVTLIARNAYGTLDQTYRGQRIRSVDGTVMTMLGREHNVGGCVVHRASYFGRPEGGETVYVACSGSHWAHGSTIKEAVEDAHAKAVHIDPSSIIDEIRASGVVTRWQYRAITGACREGIRQWCAAQGIGDDVESIPLAKAIELTANSYGGDRFATMLAKDVGESEGA